MLQQPPRDAGEAFRSCATSFSTRKSEQRWLRKNPPPLLPLLHTLTLPIPQTISTRRACPRRWWLRRRAC